MFSIGDRVKVINNIDGRDSYVGHFGVVTKVYEEDSFVQTTLDARADNLVYEFGFTEVTKVD